MDRYPDLNRDILCHKQSFYRLKYIYLYIYTISNINNIYILSLDINCYIYLNFILDTYYVEVIRTLKYKYQKFMTYLLVYNIYIYYNIGDKT